MATFGAANSGFGNSGFGGGGGSFGSQPAQSFGGGGGAPEQKSFGGGGGASFGGGSGGGGGGGCHKCGEDGHFARECPQGGGGGRGGGGGGCHKCGEEGHFARECPAGGGGGPGAGDGSCRRCGGGHMVADCDQPRGEDEPPPPVTYVPDEVSVDQIFLDRINTGLNFDKYDKIEVESTGKDVPKPITDFAQAGLSPVLMENIKKSGYTKPTPIQKHALPTILSGRDLMACAQTGSGKTAAFLLPIIQHIIQSGEATGQLASIQKPQAIIIAPTRELAVQIEREARKFSYDTDCRTVCAYGGVAVSYHLAQISRGCAILVGTPGRLKAFIRDGYISVNAIKFVVLDEADRMLDQGFEPDIRQIMGSKGMPGIQERQTLMFSATFPPEIQGLAREFLKPDHVLKAVGIIGGANTDVVQEVVEVDRSEKKDKLIELLTNDMAKAKDASGKWVKKTLVFVETKRTADFVSTILSQYDLPSTSIHGDREQRQREEALRDFKSGKRPFLVATSVAARGLDIVGVDHVICYDLPSEIADYVHRVGRTGRVGNMGRSTAFYDRDNNSSLSADLVKILAEAQQKVPDWLAAEAGVGIGNAGGAMGGGMGGGGTFGADDDAW